LIDWCLTFTEQFFSYIQDENIKKFKRHGTRNKERWWVGTDNLASATCLSYGPLIMSIMLIMSCYTGFFNVRRGWQSLNTGPRFYLRLIHRTGWLWIYTSRTTDGRPFKPKKLSVPFLYPGVLYIMLFYALMKMLIIQLALFSLWPFILLYLHTSSA
jgi:hypothetical protein